MGKKSMGHVHGFPPHYRKPIAHYPPVDTVTRVPRWPPVSSPQSSTREPSFTLCGVHSASRGSSSPGDGLYSLQRSALGKRLRGCRLPHVLCRSLQPAFPPQWQHWVFFQLMLWEAPQALRGPHPTFLSCPPLIPSLSLPPHREPVLIDLWPGTRTRESIQRSFPAQSSSLLSTSLLPLTFPACSDSLFGSLPPPPINLDSGWHLGTQGSSGCCVESWHSARSTLVWPMFLSTHPLDPHFLLALSLPVWEGSLMP